MRIRLDSIGCRLNIGEIEALARRLAADGHTIVGPDDGAELFILNTCTVTNIASRKSRQLLRRLRRRHPAAKIVATGCLAELEPGDVASLGVDLVVGNEAKDELPALLVNEGLVPAGADGDPASRPPAAAPPGDRTRAFLKVQDGCDNRCTFCVVTVARGAGRSIAADSVVREVESLVELGTREVVLSGVHLGSYGHDLGRPRGLEELVRKILSETGLERLRLSSLEPWDLDPRFFEIFGDPRLLPHLHLPLQSGCDATLSRMARKITVRGFTELVTAARDSIDDVSISTDVMVGFPGETDEEFEESIANVEALSFSRLHVFRYSPRAGTRAASMPQQVAPAVATARSRRLHDLGERLATRFHERLLGRRLAVLWEDAEPLDDRVRWNGLTDNYIRVVTETDGSADLANRITEVEIDSVVPGAVIGSIPGVSVAGRGPARPAAGASLPVVGGF